MGAVAAGSFGIYEVWEEEAPKSPRLDEATPRQVPSGALRRAVRPPLVSTRTIVARDLFDPERGVKKPEEEKPVETPKENLEGVLLLGTVIAGPSRYAILHIPAGRNATGTKPLKPRSSTPDLLQLTVGDSLNGYRVADIQEQKVVFQRGDTTTEVALDYTRVIAPVRPKPSQARKSKSRVKRPSPRRRPRRPSRAR